MHNFTSIPPAANSAQSSEITSIVVVVIICRCRPQITSSVWNKHTRSERGTCSRRNRFAYRTEAHVCTRTSTMTATMTSKDDDDDAAGRAAAAPRPIRTRDAPSHRVGSDWPPRGHTNTHTQQNRSTGTHKQQSALSFRIILRYHPLDTSD